MKGLRWAQRWLASRRREKFYGACGVERCDRCRPLFDADNVEIGGT